MRLGRWLFGGVVGVVCAVACAEPTHRIDAEAARGVLRRVLEETGVPSISAAAADDAGVLFAGAVGVRVARGSSAVADDEPFHIGSCSKAMTATLLAMLVEEGKLRWDMTLAETLPDVAGAMHEKYRAVTLASLVRHRAGLPAFTSGVADEFKMLEGLDGTATEQRAEFARRVLSAAPASAPGAFAYSNASYGVASAIAEHATGAAWEDLMRDRVFKPIGMTTAGFGWPAHTDHPRAPRGHYADPKLGMRPQPLDDTYELPPALDAAGDIHCSAADLARFCRLHLRGLMGLDTELLTSASIKELHRPDGDYAAGWGEIQMNGRSASTHDGSAGTFYTRVVIIPERNIVVVTNTNFGGGADACARSVDGLLELVE